MLFHVSDHPHYFTIRAEEVDTLSDRILTGEEFLGQPPVYHDNVRALGIVGIGECSALDQRNLRRAKISWSNNIVAGERSAAGRIGPARDRNSRAVAVL